MIIRDLLRYFSADRCAKLGVIEQYKERKGHEYLLPFSLKLVCIFSVFVIALLVVSLPLILAMGYDYSISWMPFAGLVLVASAYFLRNRKEFLYQYFTILMLVSGFVFFSLGIDALFEGATPLIMASGALLLFILTYNIFNNDVYHFFATLLICVLLTAVGYQAGLFALQVLFAGLVSLSVFMFLCPLKHVNLYSVAKALTVYSGVALFILAVSGELMPQDGILRTYLAFAVLVMGLFCLLYKDRGGVVPLVFLVTFMFLNSLLSSYCVGFAFTVMLLAYVLGSITMFVFGIIYYTVYSYLFYIELDIAVEHRIWLLFMLGGIYLILALLFRKRGADVQK